MNLGTTPDPPPAKPCMRDMHALGLVLVDYSQLMRGDGQSPGNREQEISGSNCGLKELAKELNVLVITLSQLSRDVEKRGGRSARSSATCASRVLPSKVWWLLQNF